MMLPRCAEMRGRGMSNDMCVLANLSRAAAVCQRERLQAAHPSAMNPCGVRRARAAAVGAGSGVGSAPRQLQLGGGSLLPAWVVRGAERRSGSVADGTERSRLANERAVARSSGN